MSSSGRIRRFLLCLLVIFGLSPGAKLELHDLTEMETRILKFNGSYLFTDQDSFPRSEVKGIIFGQGTDNRGEQKNTNQDVQKLIDAAKKAWIEFPDAKGIILTDDGHNILHQDGTRTYTYHYAYLICSEDRKDEATFRYPLEESEYKVKIGFARLIKPNGSVTELDPSQVKIETPSREDLTSYGREKELTFTLPGVEIGDIVEYSYEDYNFNPWSKELFQITYHFQAEDPVVYSRLVVDVPLDEYTAWKAYNMPKETLHPKIETKDGRKIYTWEAENIPAYIQEPYSPPHGDFIPKVRFTNQESWDWLFDWYASFQQERMKVTPRIQTLVDSLTGSASNEEEKIAAIYHWVQQNIRYISIKAAAGSSISGHPAAFTLERGFGDCTDKANLFSAMLRAAGIDSDPVYLGTNDDYPMLDPTLPLDYGNHCINEVFLADTNFYLDATGSANGGYSRYPSFASMDHGVYAVNAGKRKVEMIPVPEPDKQTRHYYLDLNLDQDGTLTVNYHSLYQGDYETDLRYFWNYYSKAQDRKVLFEQMVKDESPNAELLNYEVENASDISKRLGLKITYRITDYVKFTGPLAIFYLPEVSARYIFDEVGLTERKLPLSYYTSEGIQHHVTLKLPESWKIDYMPEELSLEADEVSYYAMYTFNSDVIRFEDQFKRYARIIEPSRYTDYRTLLNTISGYHTKPILVLVDQEK